MTIGVWRDFLVAGALRPFRRSVRHKLLFLVLSPLLLGVPVLLLLVWFWVDDTYTRLLRFKIGSDLVVANEYYQRVKDDLGSNLVAFAASSRLALVRASREGRGLQQELEALRLRHDLDFVILRDQAGRVLAAAPGDRGHPAELEQQGPGLPWRVVEEALTGRPRTALDVFSAEQLAAVSPDLRMRAHLPLLATPNSAPDPRAVETRGLVLHGAVPLQTADGHPDGALEAGLLLNGNLGFVDRINHIVYRDGALPLGSRGTATLFLGDARIATNVNLFEGQRALGTRVSQAVRDHVLVGGHTWLDTAFVVNDWYVSGYQPLEDARGERVGMLYVGFLEAPFHQAKLAAMGSLFFIFALISVAGAVFSLRWARSIFLPMERISTVILRLRAGDEGARVGPVESLDEVGDLAKGFDGLLDQLSAQRDELRRWADELDRKVAERTAALHSANDQLTRAQQQLAMSEKLAAIGELTAGVAHEINNPVAVIQGNLDVLREILGPAAGPVEPEIRLIDEQIFRIRLIVTKLLQFARPADFAGYLEPVDVNGTLADCLVLSRHHLQKQGVRVIQSFQATRAISINRNELQQVFINLIVNAVQAMPEGGVLTLSTHDSTVDGMEAVTVRVEDTGHGIPPEVISRIFDPFYTTKKQAGTGLGLSISYAIVERYGGHLSVDSKPEEGAAFTVELRVEPIIAATPLRPH